MKNKCPTTCKKDMPTLTRVTLTLHLHSPLHFLYIPFIHHRHSPEHKFSFQRHTVINHSSQSQSCIPRRRFTPSMAGIGRNLAGPLMFINFLLYLLVLGFASWCLNRYINGQTNHPSFGGNGATGFFLTFAILASVVGIVSKLAGANHVRFWRNDSLAAAASSALVAWAITALAMGLACKEIHVGGYRGWRLRTVEALIIILTFTQLLYLLLLHAGVFNSRYGPGYRDADYGLSAGDPMAHKGPARI